ncbi:MAG: GIY-YIG nuclease family protein [Planctomyces sp.]
MPDFPQRPFFIRILVPTGDSDGLRIVEKSNWPGVGVVFNRTNYKEVVNRTEFGKTGVYVLIGTSDDSILPVIYVGEGDPVRNRLNQHYGKKDFWNWAVFFVAKDDSLNKAHVQHLESELLRLAKEAKQCRLDNSQEPLPPTLSEADTVFVESFLQDIVSIFPLLGLIESKGIRATGFEDARGFVVVNGSQVVKDEVQSIHQNISNLRKDLLDQGVIVNNGQTLTFAQDQVFGSPSTAAAVILGRSANGRTEWRNRDGTTLKQIQLAVTADAEELPPRTCVTAPLATHRSIRSRHSQC